MRKLYHADDDPPFVGPGSWWTPDWGTAEAYTEEGVGRGGDTLFVGRFNDARALDLTAAGDGSPAVKREPLWVLAEALHKNEEDQQAFVDEVMSGGGTGYMHDLVEEKRIRQALSRKYDWVVVYDSYPEGAETWLRLTPLSKKEYSSIKPA